MPVLPDVTEDEITETISEIMEGVCPDTVPVFYIGTSVLVVIHTSYLKRIVRCRIEVCDEKVSPTWGFPCFNVARDGDRLIFTVGGDGSKVEGWQFNTVLRNVGAVLKTIRELRDYFNRHIAPVALGCELIFLQDEQQSPDQNTERR